MAMVCANGMISTTRIAPMYDAKTPLRAVRLLPTYRAAAIGSRVYARITVSPEMNTVSEKKKMYGMVA